MQYGMSGVHACGSRKAVDFFSDGDTCRPCTNSLRAAAAGTISYVCNDGVSVQVNIGDWHISI